MVANVLTVLLSLLSDYTRPLLVKVKLKEGKFSVRALNTCASQRDSEEAFKLEIRDIAW